MAEVDMRLKERRKETQKIRYDEMVDVIIMLAGLTEKWSGSRSPATTSPAL
jgi:hypothetical protein